MLINQTNTMTNTTIDNGLFKLICFGNTKTKHIKYYCYYCGNTRCTCKTKSCLAKQSTVNYPWTVTTTESPVSTSTNLAIIKILEMLFQGKDFEKYKDEYFKVIDELPWVKNNNIQAIVVYRRLEKLMELLKK